MSRSLEKEWDTPESPAFRLAAIFIPPGDDTKRRMDDFVDFCEIFNLAREKELRKRKSEFKSSAKAFEETLQGLAESHPGLVESVRADLRAYPRSEATSHETELLKTANAWHRLLEQLNQQIELGEEAGIELIYEIAESSAMLLMMVEKLHPETMRKVARVRGSLPVLASPEPGWQQSVKERIENLELGQGGAFLPCQFHQAAGADENNPARQWAKEAVRTIEQTVCRTFVLSRYRAEILDLVASGRVAYPPDPEWLSQLSAYAPFSVGTLPQWSKWVRSLIRESVPDLHLRKEWNNVRNSLKSREQDTPGRIRNAILDDICSALKTIAPRTALPKSDSRNSATD